MSAFLRAQRCAAAKHPTTPWEATNTHTSISRLVDLDEPVKLASKGGAVLGSPSTVAREVRWILT